jgi:hypothetical protein
MRTKAVAAALVLVVLAIGGFFVGRSTGEDLDAAQSRGYAAGKTSGTASGTAKGLAKGRKETFGGAYKRSYVISYKRAYRLEGVTPPKTVKVKVQSP